LIMGILNNAVNWNSLQRQSQLKVYTIFAIP
jgi:hypothetical protein